MIWIVAVVVVVLAVAAFAFWVSRRRAANPLADAQVYGSYTDVKKAILGGMSGGPSRPKTPPQRPAGLDTRVPARVRDELAAARQADSSDWFDLYLKVADSIREELEAIDRNNDWYELLSPGRRAVLVIDTLEAEINNGGLLQYYDNSSGDGARFAPECLRMLGLDQLAGLMDRANALFADGPPADRKKRMDATQAIEDALGEMDDEFFDMDTPPNGFAQTAGTEYVLSHPDEFFK